MVPIDFLILKMVLKALTQHLDYILTGEDDIAAFVDGACIGHAFKLRHIGTASRDIHCQSVGLPQARSPFKAHVAVHMMLLRAS